PFACQDEMVTAGEGLMGNGMRYAFLPFHGISDLGQVRVVNVNMLIYFTVEQIYNLQLSLKNFRDVDTEKH
ncbi:hypothetical protein, partial [Vogesella fluminis]|uniref:hypothetical protein n=1 Tax=Vogesella fluminis TaxID=1069161 RepID=UPI001E617D77